MQVKPITEQGKRLHHFRTHLGISLRALARATTINHQTLYNWEARGTAPEPQALLRGLEVLMEKLEGVESPQQLAEETAKFINIQARNSAGPAPWAGIKARWKDGCDPTKRTGRPIRSGSARQPEALLDAGEGDYPAWTRTRKTRPLRRRRRGATPVLPEDGAGLERPVRAAPELRVLVGGRAAAPAPAPAPTRRAVMS